MKRDRLVVLSVPFERLIRAILTAPVLDPLSTRYDLVIVSPFAEDDRFRRMFEGRGVQFVKWDVSVGTRKVLDILYSTSEILRVQGYYRRYRDRGMGFYYANRTIQFGRDGDDRRYGIVKWLLMEVLSRIGKWPGAWRLLDRAIQSRYRYPGLTDLTERYERVTLVQCSSWGNQDRALAGLARLNGWRNVLIPYTTDQLFCNGDLMADFDAVCVQGSVEAEFARELHQVPEDRILKLGSPWFRKIKEIARHAESVASVPRQTQRRIERVMFAGVSTTYFPFESQLGIIDLLREGLRSRYSDEVRLVLRPVLVHDGEKERFLKHIGSHADLEIQWPEGSSLGLSSSRIGGDTTAELSSYVDQLNAVDLIVMASHTTLCLDAAVLEIPSVGVFADKTGVLRSRNIARFLRPDRGTIMLPHLTTVHELDQLLPIVFEMLERPDAGRDLARRLVADWDFQDSDFEATLVSAVEGQPC
jgi:hypothetical protein